MFNGGENLENDMAIVIMFFKVNQHTIARHNPIGMISLMSTPIKDQLHFIVVKTD